MPCDRHSARLRQGPPHFARRAIDLAATGQPGAGLDPFNGNFDADAINGPDILDDLVNQAAPPEPPPHA